MQLAANRFNCRIFTRAMLSVTATNSTVNCTPTCRLAWGRAAASQPQANRPARLHLAAQTFLVPSLQVTQDLRLTLTLHNRRRCCLLARRRCSPWLCPDCLRLSRQGRAVHGLSSRRAAASLLQRLRCRLATLQASSQQRVGRPSSCWQAKRKRRSSLPSAIHQRPACQPCAGFIHYRYAP